MGISSTPSATSGCANGRAGLDGFRRKVIVGVGASGAPLPALNVRGEAHVVVAMEYENTAVLTRRLILAGGCANVFIGSPTGEVSASFTAMLPGASGTADGEAIVLPSEPLGLVGDLTRSLGLHLDEDARTSAAF